jgi:hypothetical protein
MPVRLEFIGQEIIHRDPVAFLENLRKELPNMSEKAFHAIAGAEFEKRAPRHDYLVVHLFGRDILTDDITTIAAWPDVDPQEHPALLNATIAERERKIDPPGLSTTYVWRKSNGWVQEVSDSDLDVIRQSAARTWFRDIDTHGAWVPKRAWDLPVRERYEASTLDDAAKFVADIKRNPQWQGR